MASGTTSKTFMWGIMGLLIVGLGGFGATNLSGNITRVGSVGDEDIDVNEYARALQQDIRAIEAQTGSAMTFDQVLAAGVDRAALGRLIGQAALDNEAAKLGLSIGDENLSQQIVQIDAFQGANGFDRESYRFALNQAGLSEIEFEGQMRADTVRAILQGAVVTGAPMPSAYADTLIGFAGERRDFTWALLSAADLMTAQVEPTEEQLTKFHADNAADFTSPAKKRLTYVWLSPDALVAGIDVDEERITALYEERKDQFIVAERRLVERLIYSDAAAADAAKAALDAGEKDFETLVADRGLDLADVDMGDVTAASLGVAGADVFALDGTGVVGPVETTLGPALFRVNGVLPGSETSLDEAREELHAELASDAARRQIDRVAEDLDDLLAGGATLEELEGEGGAVLSSIDWHAGSEEEIAGYADFRSAALAAKDGDYPEVIRLDDGGIAALRWEANIDAALQPLEEVRDAVTAAYKAEQINIGLAAQGEIMVNQLVQGAGMAELGLTARPEADMIRSDFISEAPAGLIDEVFKMQDGGVTVIRGTDSVAIVKLDAIKGPDENDAEVTGFRTLLAQQGDAGISDDLYAAYARAIQDQAGIYLDQTALNAVHANFR
ncbi:Peptidyl-prolyl cis-trans isomerase D [Thalassovita autumnalis]|uniref:Peptidyl-prolyl cis-trans isomerase D n=1 Tax=Thalassovita autumnalis TaxID=2072972 RepID=A0A0N7LV90_9RHOB|nr:peptidylprolyl isomerase [Thalassovita autumnalis]CUH65634.1 Peptidyl-prolyl cis-trans isomerase D [Thalassovita autumnalis]CUH70603.1 Peptidyl-prolyl cis-trans isomerase D [Thalassovita autumnalis]